MLHLMQSKAIKNTGIKATETNNDGDKKVNQCETFIKLSQKTNQAIKKS